MAQKYRIYINDNTLFITDLLTKLEEKYQVLDIQDFDLPAFCKKLKNNSKKCYVILSDNPKETFKKIKSKCVLIRAAGGLVESDHGNYLFIFRNKKWDLPKGKLELGEKMKEAAVREVEEECGVTVFKREEKLCKTYHVYPMGKDLVLKKTNWYRMKVSGEPKLIPQKEEGIELASWLKKEELIPVLKNTYPSIIDVLNAGKLI